MTKGRLSAWDRYAEFSWPEADQHQVATWGGTPRLSGTVASERAWRRLGLQVRSRPLNAGVKILAYIVGRILISVIPVLAFILLVMRGKGGWLWVGQGLTGFVGVLLAIYVFNAPDIERTRNLRAFRRVRCRLTWGLGRRMYMPGPTGAELIDRRRFWKQRARKHNFMWGWIAASVMILDIPMVAIEAFAAHSAWYQAICLLAICGCISVVLMVIMLGVKSRRLGRALQHVSCPFCGYDLMPPGGLGDGTAGVFIGPSRCPECGDRWPLVPPPVPASQQSNGARG